VAPLSLALPLRMRAAAHALTCRLPAPPAPPALARCGFFEGEVRALPLRRLRRPPACCPPCNDP
jgi:hypothetical protein